MNRYYKYFFLLMVIAASLFLLRWFKNLSKFSEEFGSKNHFTLRVVADSAAKLYIHSVSVISPHYSENVEYPEFDPITKTSTYFFDSLRKEEVKVQLLSLPNISYFQKINLDSDTTISISKTEFPAFQMKNITPGPTFTDLQPGEEITIEMRLIGCFAGFSEKLILKKQEIGYMVQFFSDRYDNPTRIKRNPGEDFTDTLASFQKSFLDYFNTGIHGGCTTQTVYLIGKQNSVWKFSDGNCPQDDPTGYKNLLKALGIFKYVEKEAIYAFVPDTFKKLSLQDTRIADTSKKLLLQY